ncbi:putative subunit E of vacuolar ATP synthase [Ordospora colligata]|uniref:Putative subunit E of vacuolar ATP synthase n=1 Tax=Ordospora colligata OC4 TaxID=1354746 RepID=A0A0B2UHK0_9MICR|nr:putative subunit E of vacuolar ATP synthase [Ordospora colligata OC4]KHN70561.1 putative subunit E of vacuolar ATP synthase [Ordospora colligata OC4]TBU17311.1 putative subunit E of vacuolar ATP synthase [Ordospora colligata]TBU17561.1 putative subunit E of vacuolar ATP synthase [Ordospora colligata]TBU19741.1 putative subunit E of vacuolar ATP synthase [Ordospora colligata]
MEKVPSKDIDRMMAFINHEADEKIKEMKIKAIQEYNAEKARIIKEETMKEENEFMMKQREIESKRVMTESSLENLYRQKYLQEKVKILKNIYRDVLKECLAKPLNALLIDECMKKMEDDFIVYCNNKDVEIVKNHCKDAEIREMVSAGTGGIILCSKDYKSIVDNSFTSRLETIKNMFEADINKVIFR